MKAKKIILWLIALFVGLPSLLVGAASLYIVLKAKSKIVTITEVSAHDYAIVLGAAVRPGGSLSPAAYDRVFVAAELYKAGKVKKILISGDNRSIYYNEPAAMGRGLVRLGVPLENIVFDYGGLRTYDTCYRAAYVFDVKNAIIVTQQFHLSRAIYLCQKMGLNVVGVAADKQSYGVMVWYQAREQLARFLAFWQVNISRPAPHFPY